VGHPPGGGAITYNVEVTPSSQGPSIDSGGLSEWLRDPNLVESESPDEED
jgi:hypothetical protein